MTNTPLIAVDKGIAEKYFQKRALFSLKKLKRIVFTKRVMLPVIAG